MNRIIQYVSVKIGFLHSVQHTWGSSKWLWFINSLLYFIAENMACLTINLLGDILVVFSIRFSWIKLLWSFMYRLYLDIIFISLDKFPGLQSLGHTVTIHLGCLFQNFVVALPFYIQIAINSIFSASLLAFGIVTLFI